MDPKIKLEEIIIPCGINSSSSWLNVSKYLELIKQNIGLTKDIDGTDSDINRLDCAETQIVRLTTSVIMLMTLVNYLHINTFVEITNDVVETQELIKKLKESFKIV